MEAIDEVSMIRSCVGYMYCHYRMLKMMLGMRPRQVVFIPVVPEGYFQGHLEDADEVDDADL